VEKTNIMNPTENLNQEQQTPQVDGAQGAQFSDYGSQTSSSTSNPRRPFAPEMLPGTKIPGNPNAPIQGTSGKVVVNANSTQNHLQIAEIRDGIVIMNDGSFRSVVMLRSINFDLMSPSEREAVEFGYQSFLNSLYFPIQIFVRSERIDIKPYIDRLDKIRSEHDNMLLALLMDDYLDFIDNLASQTNIMDKHFYLTIPYFPATEGKTSKGGISSTKSMFDGIFGMLGNNSTRVVIDENKLEEAKTELRNRVQAVLNGLMQTGVQGLPLDTQELIELYYDAYNPDTATHQQLKNFDDMSVPVVTKGEGLAPQPNLDRDLQDNGTI